jgi:hypothetical protein
MIDQEPTPRQLLEQVVSRHLMREFADRNRWDYMKPLSRIDLRDAVKALRYIRSPKKSSTNNQ